MSRILIVAASLPSQSLEELRTKGGSHESLSRIRFEKHFLSSLVSRKPVSTGCGLVERRGHLMIFVLLKMQASRNHIV